MEKYRCITCGDQMIPIRDKYDPELEISWVVFACPNENCLSKDSYSMVSYDDLIENDIAGQWDIDVRNSVRDWNPNVIVCPDCAGDAVYSESVFLTEGLEAFEYVNTYGDHETVAISVHPVSIFICRECGRTIVEG